MDAKNMYNMAYNQFTPDFISKENIRKIDEYLNQNNESLIDFIDKYREQFCVGKNLTGVKWLEVGCGLGSLSHYVNKHGGTYTGLDFSNLAISQAKMISELKQDESTFILADVSDPSLDLNQKFDIIIDSHLLHCLTSNQDRSVYYEFIKKHLKADGVFLVETMCFDKNMNIPIGYEFCENYILKKEIKESYLPIRLIKTPKAIEEELQNSPLKIKTFFYHNELGFNIYEDFPNIEVESLPRTIRFSLELA